MRGCNQDISSVTIGGYSLTRCPLKYVTQLEWMYLDAYVYFAKGILPNAGGWLEQPVKFGMVMQIIDNFMNAQDKEQARQWQNK
jgi:hypothetical protein